MRRKITTYDRLAAFDRQRGRCPACDGELGTVGDLHHRRMRSQGGDEAPANLVLLHPACHRAVHAHPQAAVEAGLLVPSWADPAAVPVRAFIAGHRPGRTMSPASPGRAAAV